MEFTKHGSRREVAWEVAGLEWLRRAQDDGGAAVVPVLRHDATCLVEPRLVEVSPSAAAAEAFGRALARTHLAGAAGFGAAPDGWQGDGFIGTTELPMPPQPLAAWGDFEARFRLEPFARQAFDAGALARDDLAAVERVCGLLAEGAFDDGRPAARIHGDLWAGNLLFTGEGAVLVDPAAHGGHAEADLAMLALFGAPHLPRIAGTWAEVWQPADGWQERTALHQLHPVLVHAVLFGGGYGARAGELARQVA